MNDDVELVKAAQEVDDKLKGIGGWLILPAIGLVFGIIIGTIEFFTLPAYYDGLYKLELIVYLALLALTIYAAIKFFGKKKNAPKIMIILYSVSLVASLFLFGVELSVGADEFAVETGKQLVRDIATAVIWIPYFSISKRVKATFVNV